MPPPPGPGVLMQRLADLVGEPVLWCHPRRWRRATARVSPAAPLGDGHLDLVSLRS